MLVLLLLLLLLVSFHLNHIISFIHYILVSLDLTYENLIGLDLLCSHSQPVLPLNCADFKTQKNKACIVIQFSAIQLYSLRHAISLKLLP